MNKISQNKNISVCAIGECMVELYYKNSNKLSFGFAGDTANAAIYMARMGLNTSYLTATGVDNISNKMIKYLSSEKINTSFIKKNISKTIGIYLIETDSYGERRFTYWRSNSAAKYLFQDISINNFVKNLKNCNAIYFSGITLSIYDNQNLKNFYKFIVLLKKIKNIEIIMDLNIRKSNWLNKSKMQNIIKKFTLVSNLIFLSEEDLNNINFKSIKKFCGTFCNNHSNVIFRKSNGLVYLYIKNNLKYKVSLSMRKKVIDTTGCGDSFNASFINDYLQDNCFFDTVKKAHKLASKVAMNRGAIIKKEN